MAAGSRADAQTMADEDRAQGLLTDAVRAEQVRVLYASSGFSLVSTVVAAAILTGVLLWQRVLSPWIAGVFLSLLVANTLHGLWQRHAYDRAVPGPAAWRPWARRFVLRTAAGGVLWGTVMPFMLAPGRFDLQMLVAAMMISGTYGIVGSAGAYLPAFYTFVLPFPTIIAWFALQGDPLHLAVAAITLFWMPTVAVLGRSYNATLTEALKLRFENAALVDDLRIQKHAAEQSALAKSRFLAAASHDLRQPVHALGMFVGALRGHKLPPRSKALIDHIDASVGALDGLFTSLLDISRLDAGVVESRPQAVVLQPIIARVCRDLRGEAAAKGIRLVQHPTTLAAQTDPLHLERILRNLIGNAVRYTDRGRVVVGVRRTGQGAEARLEVWDSGPGVPAGEREAIFEEFYQLGNADRDRAKGLGLGLAIVRRLTQMLGHGLAFDTRLGRGSVFRVSLQRVAAPAPELALVQDPGVDAPAGLVLVIDDEPAIRIGMRELLTGWGHRVLAAADGDEAVELLAAEGRPADLIISDYRLVGDDGIAVIRRLERAFRAAPPAILLTGDTAPERIREAQASGYPILHKPVSHGRLRAAVTNLLRRAQTPQAVD